MPSLLPILSHTRCIKEYTCEVLSTPLYFGTKETYANLCATCIISFIQNTAKKNVYDVICISFSNVLSCGCLDSGCTRKPKTVWVRCPSSDAGACVFELENMLQPEEGDVSCRVGFLTMVHGVLQV